MFKTRQLVTAMLALVLASCATTRPLPQEASQAESYEIVEVLPRNIEGFSFYTTKTFPKPWGYSLSYKYGRKQDTRTDVYIYPVPTELAGRGREQIVNEMTRSAIAEVEAFRDQGSYTDYELLRAQGMEIAGVYAARADFYLVRQNLASYSLLFVTESHGKLLKVRMTMPDNPANRDSEKWQQFVERVFKLIIDNIDLA